MPRTTIAQALLATTVRPAQIRTGTVSTVTATTLDVIVGGTTITAAYLDSYAPSVGDLVVVGNQDASWVVLGKQAGVGPNLITDPGFESGGEGPGLPADWLVYNESGTASFQTLATDSAPEGDVVLQVNPDLSARTTVVYSQPFALAPGQTYALSVFAAGVNGATGDVTLHLLCFANSTDLMPTTSADVTAATVNNVDVPTPYTAVSGTALVPAGASAFGRIGLRSVLASGIGMLWDFAIVRRIG